MTERERLDAATRDLDPPFALVDLDAFDANAADMEARAAGVPIRVASKSVRCLDLIRRALARPGFAGVLAFTLPEALWLHGEGVSDDILVAYPTVDRGGEIGPDLRRGRALSMRWMMTPRALGVPTGLRRASALRWRSDERLARLAAAGDEAAFGVLYERHHGALYRYCRSIVRDEHDAQDALQGAMASALAGAGTWCPGVPVRAWLFRIAHNEAVSLLRRRRRVATLDEAPEPVSASAESQLRERDRLATLVADLRDLPERQRAALVMRELSGLGHEEIAAALSTSTATAKQAIFEARIALAEFGEGRKMDCDVVRRALSDGDRRVLRGRRIRAHLRDCTVCSRFQAAIPARRAELAALAPPLPAAAAGGLLAQLVAGVQGTVGIGAQAASMPIVAKVAVGGMVLAAAAGTTERVVRSATPARPAPTATASARPQAAAPARVVRGSAPARPLTRSPAAGSSATRSATSSPKNAKPKKANPKRRATGPGASTAAPAGKAKGRPTSGPGSRRAAPAVARRATPAAPKAPASRRPATRPSRAAKAKGNARAEGARHRWRPATPPAAATEKPGQSRRAG